MKISFIDSLNLKKAIKYLDMAEKSENENEYNHNLQIAGDYLKHLGFTYEV